ADHVFDYAADLVRATRPRDLGVPKFIPELLTWGAGPRASQYLILGGKARAILHGRLHVTTEDIRHVAYPVLRHRLVTTFNADARRPAATQGVPPRATSSPRPPRLCRCRGETRRRAWDETNGGIVGAARRVQGDAAVRVRPTMRQRRKGGSEHDCQ